MQSGQVDEHLGIEWIRCSECRREVDEFVTIRERWTYWSDGCGELMPFCPECAEQFASASQTVTWLQRGATTSTGRGPKKRRRSAVLSPDHQARGTGEKGLDVISCGAGIDLVQYQGRPSALTISLDGVMRSDRFIAQEPDRSRVGPNVSRSR